MAHPTTSRSRLAAFDAEIDIEFMLRERGYKNLCGVDEAGRGPLAGPVVAAAVILPTDCAIEGLQDSKQLTADQRDRLFEELADDSIVSAVGIMDHAAIDTMNILRASLMAMRKAVLDLAQTPDVVLVDGTFAVPNLSQPQYAIVKGDSRCRAIAAASIVAKVTRDRIMSRYQDIYPHFSFAAHKGYPTAEHLRELREFGPCDIHRRSFRPVAEMLDQYELFKG
ncbi:MAG: ribonuclease HII [candidate division Zixibacteria bacterium]|jgi:ribonuclease HII|nr:ribonuclease HII [candidate division Zixibacteria bacterium]